jgi:hypothetical protein
MGAKVDERFCRWRPFFERSVNVFENAKFCKILRESDMVANLNMKNLSERFLNVLNVFCGGVLSDFWGKEEKQKKI